MSRPLNVLVVMGPIAQGGAEWQLLELLRRVDRSRFRPVLASVQFSAYKELQIGPGDAAIRAAYDALDVPHYRITGYARNSTRNARELMRVIRHEQIDVVHANLYAGETWGRAAAILTGTPVVTHKRGIPFKSRKPQNVLVDWLLNLLSQRIIVVNQAIQRRLQRLQRLPSGKFSVVYPGIDPSLWRRAGECETAELRRDLGLEGKQVVTAVGRLRPIKGFRYLVEAWPGVCSECPDARLLLVGHGEQEQELRRRVEELGLGDTIQFLGSRSDVRLLLSLSDVAVLASISEASPVALMEAAFVGTPAVATWVGGVPEVVRDGVTGTLVPPRNPRALSDALTGLLRDDSARVSMSEAAVEWAHYAFDINRTVRQIELEYLRAAGARDD
ncbi:MAG: glycosyltransferase [Chloroflexota bacterium]|nr:glycosyltransferase [Chloroflexota bacterium]